MNLIPQLPPTTASVIQDFIKAKVKNAGAKGVVLGLSGGIDSAVTCALCATALGKENVYAAFMPEGATPELDRTDVKEIAEILGVELHTFDISEQVVSLYELMGYRKEPPKDVHMNLKARTRMVLLYGIANDKNYLVAGTSNKTELMVGYFTKYGDGASDLGPIGDLFKTQVKELARELDLGEEIVEKVPTAGLYPGQTDEEELGMKYSVLDQILVGLDYGLDYEKIERLVQPEGDANLDLIHKVEEMVRKTAHKRNFTKIPKMGMRTIGIDRRELND